MRGGSSATEQAANPRFIRHEEGRRRIYLLDRGFDGVLRDIDLTALEWASVAVGPKDKVPTGGTFGLEYDGDGDELEELAFGIAEDVIETALNANPAIAADDGVTVVKTGSLYTVTFNEPGERGEFTASAAGLTPPSKVVIDTVTDGDVDTRAVYSIWLLQQMYAESDDFEVIDADDGEVEVTELEAGAAGVFASHKVAIDPEAVSGAFPFKWSLPQKTRVSVQANTAVRAVYELQCAGDFGGSLAGKYLDLRDDSNVVARVWMNDGLAGAPATPSGGRLIGVSYVQDDVAAVMANRISDALIADGDWTVAYGGTTGAIQITAAVAGVKGAVTVGTLQTFTLDEIVAGSAGQLAGEGFVLDDANGDVGVYATVGGLPTTVPEFAAACSRQIAIPVTGGATASTAATEFRTGLIADSAFTNSTVSGNVVTVIDSVGGERAGEAASGNEAYFGVTIERAGAAVSISVPYNSTATSFQTATGGFFSVAQSSAQAWIVTRTTAGESPAPTVSNGTLRFRSGLEGTLSFRRQSLRQAFAETTSNALDCFLEVKLKFTGQEPTVVLQIQAAVTRDLQTGSPGGADFDVALSGKTGVNFLTLSGLEGGAGYLDGIPTTGLIVPRAYAFKSGSQLAVYVLEAGTDVEATPGVIRPLDFNASTNAKVWKQLL